MSGVFFFQGACDALLCLVKLLNLIWCAFVYFLYTKIVYKNMYNRMQIKHTGLSQKMYNSAVS